MAFVVASILVLILAGSIPPLLLFRDEMNIFLMGFFRDIAIVKATNRRMNNTNAVISVKDIRQILLHRDDDKDPLKDLIETIMNDEGFIKPNNFHQQTPEPQKEEQQMQELYDPLPTYTREELYELGNGDNGVILLSLFGRVYDVSTGTKFYGKDGKYHIFAGRDVTRALSTGCLEEKCLGSKTSLYASSTSKNHDDESSISSDKHDEYFDLNEKVVREGKKWVAFFEVHDTYSHVGFLKDGQSIEQLIDKMVEGELNDIND